MENLNNLPPFFVGQKVVYITGINMPKGTIDEVAFISKRDCKCPGFCIVLRKNKSKYPGFKNPNTSHGRCVTCGYIRPKENIIVGCFSAESFRPLQEATLPLITYSKVLEEVLVSNN